MFPDLISIALSPSTPTFLCCLGFAVGIWTAIKVGKHQGIPSQQVMDMAFVMIIWAIIGHDCSMCSSISLLQGPSPGYHQTLARGLVFPEGLSQPLQPCCGI